MTDETLIQPQPQPQPLPQAQAIPQAPQLTVVPALQGISNYFAMGSNHGAPMLYSYDVALGQWRIAQQAEIERVMVSLGVPANVLQAMKSFRF